MTLRKRIDGKFFNDIMLSMHKNCIKKSDSEKSDRYDSGISGNGRPSEISPVTHKGKMKMEKSEYAVTPLKLHEMPKINEISQFAHIDYQAFAINDSAACF